MRSIVLVSARKLNPGTHGKRADGGEALIVELQRGGHALHGTLFGGLDFCDGEPDLAETPLALETHCSIYE